MNRKLLGATFVLIAGFANVASAQMGAGDNAAIGANRPFERRLNGDGVNQRLERNRARNENLSNTLSQRAPFSGGNEAWGDYGYSQQVASTAMGDVMRGAAEGIKATGEAVRNGSEAAVNLEVAKKLYVENNYEAAETFWEKRRLWAENSAYQRGNPLSQEQLRQLARDAAPQRLSILQLHPMTGDINWPAALLRPQFERLRTEVEDVFTNRTVSNTGLGSTTESAVTRLTGIMQSGLKSQFDELTPNEYLAAKSFLRSLAYETRFMPSADGIAQR